jgi:hypothetical protein
VATPKTTIKTIETLRSEGYFAANVEKIVPRVHTKRDLFGLWDVLGVHPDGRPLLAVQACGSQDVQKHLSKLSGEDEEGGDVLLARHMAWLRCGGSSELWSWRRLKFRLKDNSWSKLRRWRCKRWTFELSPGGVTYHQVSE